MDRRSQRVAGMAALLIAGAAAGEDAGQLLRLEGTVRLPGVSGQKGKQFRGVMLEVKGGKTWVLGYTRDALWSQFADQRVVVQGVQYQPPGQALVAPHLRAHSWKVVDRQMGAFLIEAGPERTLEATWELHLWPEGTKLAGERTLYLREADGTRWRVANPRPNAPEGEQVTVRIREVRPSPFIAGVGDPAVWLLEDAQQIK